jgi:hypothetical protein
MVLKTLSALILSLLMASTVKASNSCESIFVHWIEYDFYGVNLPSLYQLFKSNYGVTVYEVPQGKMPSGNERDIGLYLLKKKQVYIAKSHRPIVKFLVAQHELVHVRYFDRFQNYPESIENFMGTTLTAGTKNKFAGKIGEFYPKDFKLEEIIAFASDIKNSYQILSSKRLSNAADIEAVQKYYQESLEVFDALSETALSILKDLRSYVYDHVRSKQALKIKIFDHFLERNHFYDMQFTIRDNEGVLMYINMPYHNPTYSKSKSIDNLETELIKKLDYAIKRIILTTEDVKSFRSIKH